MLRFALLLSLALTALLSSVSGQSTCRSDSDCARTNGPGSTCLRGFCSNTGQVRPGVQPATTSQSCRRDKDCGQDMDCEKGFCVPDRGLRTQFSKGVRQVATSTKTCRTSSECATEGARNACHNGHCLQPCTRDRDCGLLTGDCEDDGPNRGFCEARGSQCAFDRDCGRGLECDDGFCVPDKK